jgi:hypothetical protein
MSRPVVEWDRIAGELGYRTQREMWTELYSKRGMSLLQLSRRFAVSPNTVRNALALSSVPLKGRGGPNNTGLDLPENFVEIAKREGVAATAKKFRVSMSMVYKRLHRAKSEEAPPEVEPAKKDPEGA